LMLYMTPARDHKQGTGTRPEERSRNLKYFYSDQTGLEPGVTAAHCFASPIAATPSFVANR
jgi:hypothetical protein